MGEMVFSEIANRLRRAARNGERLHLDQAHVVALLGSRAYSIIAELEAEEIASPWQALNGLGNSGSHGEPTGASGRYAGMTEPLEPAAESQLALAATTMALRHAKRLKRSQNISPATENRKRSIRDPAQASPAS